MKIKNLIPDFEIILNNEEKGVLDKMSGVMVPEQFTEREKFVIENMVRKSVVTKIRHKGKIYLVQNDKYNP